MARFTADLAERTLPNGYVYRAMFATLLKQMFGECEREYRFHPIRRFRFDYAIPIKKIAIEQEGGAWTKAGRHTTAKRAHISDMEKYNLACIQWVGGCAEDYPSPDQMMKTETLNLNKKRFMIIKYITGDLENVPYILNKREFTPKKQLKGHPTFFLKMGQREWPSHHWRV